MNNPPIIIIPLLGVDRFTDRDHSMISKILDPYAGRWRDIGQALGFTKNELNNIQANPMLMLQIPPKSWLKEMLSMWLQWAPGDGRGSSNYATRSSLRAALLEINLGTVAENF